MATTDFGRGAGLKIIFHFSQEGYHLLGGGVSFYMGESSCECQNPSCKCECCLMGWGWAMNRKRNRIKLSKRIEQKIKVLLAFKFSFYNFTFYLPSNFLSIFFKSSPTFPFYVSILFSLICLLLYNKIINKIECKGNPFFFLYS